MQMTDIILMFVSFFLTLFIFSYMVGDNRFFRFATYLFIGVTAGYVTLIIIYQVILPRLLIPLVSGSTHEKLLAVIPFVLSLLLLFKLMPPITRWGNLSMGYLVGVGAGVTIGGAVLGTLIGQISAVSTMFDVRTVEGTTNDLMTQVLSGVILLLGTVSTLAYFHFGAKQKGDEEPKRHVLIEGFAGIGKIFLAITLGALFAGVYMAAITALIERLDFMKTLIVGLFS
jgi:hypothetical protein